MGDDTAAIQARIDAGGVVDLPPGVFTVTSTPRALNPATTAAEGHALVVSRSGVHLRGAGIGVTTISHRALGGGDPTSDFQTIDGKVWRGGGIFVDAHVDGFTMSDLTLDGNTTRTGLNIWPANPATGDGWDITHKGVWLRNDAVIDNILLQRVEVKGYRGEIVYYGGRNAGRVTCRDSVLHDTNGDCWSVSAEVLLEGCELYDATSHGCEDNYIDRPSTYRHNYVHDVGLVGISVALSPSSGAPAGPLHVHDNTVTRCVRGGIRVTGGKHGVVESNTLIDCGTGGSGSRALSLITGPGLPIKDMVARANRIWFQTLNAISDGCLFVADVGGTGPNSIQNLVVEDNEVAVTALGVVNGITVLAPFAYSGSIEARSARIRRNVALGTVYGYTDRAMVRESLLGSTGVTTVAKVRPARASNYLVGGMLRVTTAPTTVSVGLRWFDASGTPQTVAVLNGVTVPVGSLPLPPLFIHACGANELQYVEVRVAAGTPGQVYVTAQIEELSG